MNTNIYRYTQSTSRRPSPARSRGEGLVFYIRLAHTCVFDIHDVISLLSCLHHDAIHTPRTGSITMWSTHYHATKEINKSSASTNSKTKQPPIKHQDATNWRPLEALLYPRGIKAWLQGTWICNSSWRFLAAQKDECELKFKSNLRNYSRETVKS